MGELTEIIKADGTLKGDAEKRLLYISYAGMFEQDLINNLDKTSIELDDMYATGNPSSWQRFLRHPSVKKFIDGFLDERADKAASAKLGEAIGKTSDAIKVKENLEKKNNGDDNSRLLVVFLPQKNYLDV